MQNVLLLFTDNFVSRDVFVVNFSPVFFGFFFVFFCFFVLVFFCELFSFRAISLPFSRECYCLLSRAFFLPQELFFCRKILPFCRDLFLFCHEHFYFAGSFFLLPSWHLWAAVITWRRKLVIFLKDLKIFWININWGDMIWK